MKYHRHKQKNQQKTTHTADNSAKPKQILSRLKETVMAHDLVTDSRAVARLSDGSVVFVPKLLVNEKAIIQIYEQKSSYKNAEIVQILEESPERVFPLCEYAQECGGCQLQHLSAEGQISFKIKSFLETLRRVGKWDQREIESVQQIMSVSFLPTWNYRRRIRLHFDGVNFGYYANGTHKIININSCLIASPLILKKFLQIKPKVLRLVQELKNKDFIKKIECEFEFTHSDDERIVVVLVNFQVEGQKSREFCLEEFKKQLDIQDEQLIHIRHPFLSKFRLKKQSFIQPHVDAMSLYAKKIYEGIYLHFAQLLQSQKISEHHSLVAWDLYAGAGAFTGVPVWAGQKLNLSVSSLGIEGIVDAIDSLNTNYKAFPQVKGLVSDVFDFVEQAFLKKQKADIIILDPPRAGIGIAGMQQLVELLNPAGLISYLACDPASFARDTRILFEAGFKLKQIVLFDAFGQTAHYEVLGTFVR